MEYLLELFLKTCLETIYLTGVIIVMGLILGVLRNSSIRNFQRSLGSKAVMITGVIGVPIHELSHAILAVLFGHNIAEIKLLQKPDENGVMGYVKHSYNQGSIYQQIGNFFIGIAPIFGGVISIGILMRFTIPEAYNKFMSILVESLHVTRLNSGVIEGIGKSYLGLINSIFAWTNFENPYFYIFLFIAIAISAHISLSTADIKGASRGLGIIFVILFLLNLLGLSRYIFDFSIIKYNVLITGVLILALILSGVTFFVSVILVIMRKLTA